MSGDDALLDERIGWFTGERWAIECAALKARIAALEAKLLTERERYLALQGLYKEREYTETPEEGDEIDALCKKLEVRRASE